MKPLLRRRGALVSGSLFLFAGLAWAHMPILIPEAALVPRGEPVALRYQFGHPYEVELAATARPARVLAHPPQGAAVDLGASLAPQGPEAERSWSLSYTPKDRGDHVVTLESAPVEHDGETWVDHVKLVLHCGVEQGWDRDLGQPGEFVPLTRPYGLPVGVAFRATLVAGEGEARGPVAGAQVQLEYLNTEAPGELPPEPFVTRVEKTNALGELCATFDRPGWWILAAELPAAGDGPRRRVCLWVPVGP